MYKTASDIADIVLSKLAQPDMRSLPPVGPQNVVGFDDLEKYTPQRAALLATEFENPPEGGKHHEELEKELRSNIGGQNLGQFGPKYYVPEMLSSVAWDSHTDVDTEEGYLPREKLLWYIAPDSPEDVPQKLRDAIMASKYPYFTSTTEDGWRR